MATNVIALKIDVQDSGKLSSLEQELVKLNKRKAELNKLVREGIPLTNKESKEIGELGTQSQAARNKINDLKNGILQQNDALKKNSGFVNGVSKGVGQWATSMIGITAAIGIATRVIGGAVDIIINFEKANSKLRAILGANTEQMALLSDQAKDLGSKTAYTASQVTDLQTEFAKLGFPTDEILNMTSSTLDAAAALGSELGEQAALSGAILKQYSLDSTEAARVNDVLAKSASSSALDFNKLATALPIVGATAATAGVSLEKTTALLGTLSDRGIDASSAGTSLRNIFLELSNKGLTWEQAMGKINSATDKNKVAMDLFGKRGATAGVILADTAESTALLEEKLIGANGAAKAMADTMLDNLAGDITISKSAWEGFILSLEDGHGALSQLARAFTQNSTAFLGLITDLNNGKSAFDSFLNFGKITNTTMGIMTKEQSALNVALIKNEEIINVLNQRLKDKTITAEQYTASIKKIVSGWEFTKKEIEKNPITAKIETTATGNATLPDGEDEDEEEGGLTPEQKAAIAAKAKAKADTSVKEQIKAEAAARKLMMDDAVDPVVDFEAEAQALLDAKIADNELNQIVDQEFIDANKAMLDQEAIDDYNRGLKAAEDVKKFEQIKKEARVESLKLAASGLDTIASLMKEGSKQQQILASAAALVQTYLAAQSAYASQMQIITPDAPVRASIAAGIAVVQGLANVAKINNVKFAEGGMINGNSHANGGVPFTVNGASGFEAEGGEFIMNKRSTQMFAPILNALNDAGNNRLFANGGITPSSVGVTASQQSMNGLLDMGTFAETIVNGINNKEVINVATNTSRIVNQVQNVSNNARF